MCYHRFNRMFRKSTQNISQNSQNSQLREKYPNTEFFGPYFPVFGLNTGKYGPDKTSYLDTFCEA